MAQFELRVDYNEDGWFVSTETAEHGPFEDYSEAFSLASEGARILRACGNEVVLNIP